MIRLTFFLSATVSRQPVLPTNLNNKILPTTLLTMKKPSFIHRQEEYLDRVAKSNTDIRLLAKHSSVEIMKQKIAAGSTFYLDSSEEWQGFEFIYLMKGKLEYVDSEPPIELEAGDYISREGVPEESWFETKTDVTVLYTSTQPAFFLLREEIEDYLQLAEEIEATEHMDGHSKRLVRMGQEVGKKFGLSTERLSDLRYACFFHDLGKARVPDRILEKEGELTKEEWKIMEKHTIWGKEMLAGSDQLERAGQIVAQTHEKVDGGGYPAGLEGEEILLESRIVAVVDAWDAMRTDRPYRDALDWEEAIAELEDNKGSQFDPQVVEAFLNLLREEENLDPQKGEVGRYKEEAIQLRQREKLLDLSQQVLAAEDPERIIDRTLEAIVEVTPFQRALISIFNRPISLDDSSPVRVRTYSYKGLSARQEEELEERDMTGAEVNLDKFDSEYRLGNSYYVPHEERQEKFEDGTEIESQLREAETLDWHPDDSLYIPLLKEDQLIGQISVDDPEDGLVPSPSSLRPLESFASLASLGIEKSFRTDELKRQRNSLKKLHEFTEKLRGQDEVGSICEVVLEEAPGLLECDKLLIALREEGELVPKHSWPPELASQNISFQEIPEERFVRQTLPDEDGWKVTLNLTEVGILQLFFEEKPPPNKDVELMKLLADRVGEELERVNLEEKLRKKAIRDPLTGLYNRRYFNETIQREIDRGKRYGHPMAILMMDINNFKKVNDRHSHLIGDKVLKEIAALLEENIRGADLVVRYGGDEFLLMLPEIGNTTQAVVSRIKRIIDRWNEKNDLISFPLGMAIGVAHWRPGQSSDVEEVLKEADDRMYEDKRG